MVLLEEKNEQFEDFMERSMEIYLAPDSPSDLEAVTMSKSAQQKSDAF